MLKTDIINTMKVRELLPVHAALSYVAGITGLDKNLNYGVAKNLLRIKKALEEFNAENNLRLETYAIKDPATGEPLIINGQYHFGEYALVANEKYKELVEREYAFEPYPIIRNDATDLLPAIVLAELLGVIIIDE